MNVQDRSRHDVDVAARLSALSVRGGIDLARENARLAGQVAGLWQALAEERAKVERAEASLADFQGLLPRPVWHGLFALRRRRPVAGLEVALAMLATLAERRPCWRWPATWGGWR